MKSKILMVGLFLSTSLFALDSEEAIILNQELDFLEQAAKNTSLDSSSAPKGQSSRENLELKYFGESEDSVSSRSAAPKRKRSTGQ
jgi:hypothetical protein